MLGKSHEGSKQPAVTKNTLLDISGFNAVRDHFGFVLSHIMRTFPLNNRLVLSIIWRVERVDVERTVIWGELVVTVELFTCSFKVSFKFLSEHLHLLERGEHSHLLLVHFFITAHFVSEFVMSNLGMVVLVNLLSLDLHTFLIVLLLAVVLLLTIVFFSILLSILLLLLHVHVLLLHLLLVHLVLFVLLLFLLLEFLLLILGFFFL